MIRNSLRIYKGDIKRICTNYAAIIIIIALALLPSFYAWFNIKASWDPYSEEATGQIKVAVVNKDRGTTLKDKEVNIGDEVVEELKNNKTLGWIFMSEEESNSALEKGEIYASITIDEDFSKDITSFLTSDIEKGKIIYSVNEKINAIAPKITVKGATAVQENVNQTVIETVSKVILTGAQSAGYKIKEDVLPKLVEAENILGEIQGKFGDINSTIDNADTAVDKISDILRSVQNEMPLIQDTISNSEDLTKSIENFIETSKQGLNDLAPTIKEDLNIINKISGDVSNYIDAIIDGINNNSADVPAMISSLKNKLDSMGKILDSVINVLDKLNNMSINKQLQSVLNDLNSLKNGLNSGHEVISSLEEAVNNSQGIDLSSLENIKTLMGNINSTTANILNIFDSELVGKINEICDEAFVVAQNILKTLNLAETKLPEVNDILNSVLDVLGKSSNGLSYLKENLPMVEERINDLKEKMAEANESSEIKELIDLLLNDVQTRADFLKSPVEITENDLFPMGNYGSAMTPFYTVLCLWVGQTLLVSMLSVEAHGAYRPSEEYFGKLFLFVTIGIIQAVIAALGDLYILKIYCTNPLAFVLGMIYTGIVFTILVYTLVSVFGNAGKVIAIILLVLQVAGSGGTFPIQLTPKFFQIINPYLPFTYAISMARESIGGIVKKVMYRDCGILAIYILASLIIALVFKKPFNKFMKKFTKKFAESGIGE